MNIKDKKISIFGMSKMGIEAAKLAKSFGASIFLSEIKKMEPDHKYLKLLKDLNIKYETGKNTQKLLDADLIIKSPGVNSNHPLLISAKKNKIQIIGEIDFALSFLKGDSKFICITGTNGKTTSTLLLCNILKLSGRSYVLTGHRNTPMSEIVYQKLNPEFIIQEVSCSDLRDNKKIKPDIAVILNINNDHLDLFKNFKRYSKIKFSLFKNINNDSNLIINKSIKYSEFIKDEIKEHLSFFSAESIPQNILKEIPEYFKGFEEIISAVYSACKNLNIKENVIIQGMKTFISPPHRRQIIEVSNKKNITLINDAKGTNINALINCLKWISKPVILITGGKNKGQYFNILEKVFKEKVKLLIVIGETGTVIKQLAKNWNIFVVDCINDGIEKALLTAKQNALNKDIILYCPGASNNNKEFHSAEESGEWLANNFD